MLCGHTLILTIVFQQLISFLNQEKFLKCTKAANIFVEAMTRVYSSEADRATKVSACLANFFGSDIYLQSFMVNCNNDWLVIGNIEIKNGRVKLGQMQISKMLPITSGF